MRWLLWLSCACFGFAQTEPAPDLALGRQRFESQCAICHGLDGSGGRGPDLRRSRLDHAPDDPALRAAIANGIPPEMPAAVHLSRHELASVAAYVRSLGTAPSEPVPGDPAHGAQVYHSKGCANCHMIGGAGAGFGPELTDIGARRSAAYLRESLVSPEASVPDRFLMVEAVTTAGSTVSGIRINEDAFTIQLKDASGQFHSFRKAELKDLRKLRGKSPMPSYQDALTPEELTDLVAYLAGLRGKS